jgi:hypothetical protein
MRQFLMTDPGGNCIRIGQPISENLHHRPAPKETLSWALHHASPFADSRDDPAAAAKVLDQVLRREDKRPTDVQLLRLLVLRADVARRLGDEETASSVLSAAAAIHLTGEEQDSVRDDLARLAELQV